MYNIKDHFCIPLLYPHPDSLEQQSAAATAILHFSCQAIIANFLFFQNL